VSDAGTGCLHEMSLRLLVMLTAGEFTFIFIVGYLTTLSVSISRVV
jgi:hypothetical protein